MSDSDLGTPSDTSLPPGLAWGNAIKELYTKIPMEPERLANWPTDLVFTLPCEANELNNAEKANGLQQWARVHCVLTSYDTGYRLGYATKVLLDLPIPPEESQKDKLKDAIAANEGIQNFLLFFDYVLRAKGKEPDQKARALCQEAYARFFHEGFGDDNMDQPATKMKEMLDVLWKPITFEAVWNKIFLVGPNNETYFHLGMKDAAHDFESGLGRWENLSDDNWERRYKGLGRGDSEE